MNVRRLAREASAVRTREEWRPQPAPMKQRSGASWPACLHDKPPSAVSGSHCHGIAIDVCDTKTCERVACAHDCSSISTGNACNDCFPMATTANGSLNNERRPNLPDHRRRNAFVAGIVRLQGWLMRKAKGVIAGDRRRVSLERRVGYDRDVPGRRCEKRSDQRR